MAHPIPVSGSGPSELEALLCLRDNMTWSDRWSQVEVVMPSWTSDIQSCLLKADGKECDFGMERIGDRNYEASYSPPSSGSEGEELTPLDSLGRDDPTPLPPPPDYSPKAMARHLIQVLSLLFSSCVKAEQEDPFPPSTVKLD